MAIDWQKHLRSFIDLGSENYETKITRAVLKGACVVVFLIVVWKVLKEETDMYTWNGVSVAVTDQIEAIVAKAKEKKTRIWIVAAVFALGLIIFLRGK